MNEISLNKKCEMSSSFQIRLTKIIYSYENKQKSKKRIEKFHFSKKKHLSGEEKWKVHSELSNRYEK